LSQSQELSIENLLTLNGQKKRVAGNASKALRRFYANDCDKSQKFAFLPSIEPLEVISEFYEAAKEADSIESIYQYLHDTAVKIGYNFTAMGIPDSKNTHLDIRCIDFTGKIWSLTKHLDDSENIIVKSFIEGTKRFSKNLNLDQLDCLKYYECIIIPLVFQNKCRGVFIAGAVSENRPNDEIMLVLCNYAALLIANSHFKKLGSNGNIDSLTGLITHREFQEKLGKSIKKAEQADESVSVLILDINNISGINREFGHAKGDETINRIAQEIEKHIRIKDMAARYGGDEIAVILPDTDNKKACDIAKHINNKLSNCHINGVGIVKNSIGIATYPKCAKEQEKLLILAEQAMLISKHNGYKSGLSSIVSSEDIDFWNEIALSTLARVIAKRHSQWGLNFEDEIVKRFLKSKKLPRISLDVVSSLAGAIDAKDTYTRGHSQAVSEYSEALARAINLSEKKVQRIKLAALLHDVGKIGISESILRKPGALTDYEWEIMKQHPVIGAKKVLEPIKALKDLIPIVKHHHERIDGCGYPDKLKDDEIPLGAKIVAIADAFHALISHRPYRKSLNIDKAIEILKAGAGTQWDKELVRKFISIAPSLAVKP